MNEIMLPGVRSSTEKVDEIIRIITPMIDDVWKRANELNRNIIRDNNGDSKGSSLQDTSQSLANLVVQSRNFRLALRITQI